MYNPLLFGDDRQFQPVFDPYRLQFNASLVFTLDEVRVCIFLPFLDRLACLGCLPACVGVRIRLFPDWAKGNRPEHLGGDDQVDRAQVQGISKM